MFYISLIDSLIVGAKHDSEKGFQMSMTKQNGLVNINVN